MVHWFVEILDRVGAVAYRLALPPQLSSICNVFHLSMLRNYETNTSHVMHYQPPDMREDMTYMQ